MQHRQPSPTLANLTAALNELDTQAAISDERGRIVQAFLDWDWTEHGKNPAFKTYSKVADTLPFEQWACLDDCTPSNYFNFRQALYNVMYLASTWFDQQDPRLEDPQTTEQNRQAYKQHVDEIVAKLRARDLITPASEILSTYRAKLLRQSRKTQKPNMLTELIHDINDDSSSAFASPTTRLILATRQPTEWDQALWPTSGFEYHGIITPAKAASRTLQFLDPLIPTLERWRLKADAGWVALEKFSQTKATSWAERGQQCLKLAKYSLVSSVNAITYYGVAGSITLAAYLALHYLAIALVVVALYATLGIALAISLTLGPLVLAVTGYFLFADEMPYRASEFFLMLALLFIPCLFAIPVVYAAMVVALPAIGAAIGLASAGVGLAVAFACLLPIIFSIVFIVDEIVRIGLVECLKNIGKRLYNLLVTPLVAVTSLLAAAGCYAIIGVQKYYRQLLLAGSATIGTLTATALLSQGNLLPWLATPMLQLPLHGQMIILTAALWVAAECLCYFAAPLWSRKPIQRPPTAEATAEKNAAPAAPPETDSNLLSKIAIQWSLPLTSLCLVIPLLTNAHTLALGSHALTTNATFVILLSCIVALTVASHLLAEIMLRPTQPLPSLDKPGDVIGKPFQREAQAAVQAVHMATQTETPLASAQPPCYNRH